MNNLRRIAVGAALLAAAVAPAHAQDVQWVTKLQVPPGSNLPSGVTLDVLGIAPGDSPEAARAALASYAPEDMAAHSGLPTDPDVLDDMDLLAMLERGGQDMRAPFREIESGIRMGSGTNAVEISYVGGFLLDRQFGGNDRNEEIIEIAFSAPSSGHQVVGITRTLRYLNQDEQPRISELLASLTQKVGIEPTVLPINESVTQYRWQFDNGQQVHSTTGNQYECPDDMTENVDEDQVPNINRSNTCDVVLEVQVVEGISADHARGISIKLSDNERGKANLAADYAFFREYLTNYQSTTGGATPAL